MPNIDKTEDIRRVLVSGINEVEGSREYMEEKHGKIWDTDELTKEFSVEAFLAPFITVRRLSDGIMGTMMFQDYPRFYFGFRGEE